MKAIVVGYSADMGWSTTVRMSSQGRVVVPATYRNQLDITTDTDLVCYVEDGRVVYEPREHMKRRLQHEAQAAFGDSSPVDELIAERREEARREEEEHP